MQVVVLILVALQDQETIDRLDVLVGVKRALDFLIYNFEYLLDL